MPNKKHETAVFYAVFWMIVSGYQLNIMYWKLNVKRVVAQGCCLKQLFQHCVVHQMIALAVINIMIEKLMTNKHNRVKFSKSSCTNLIGL